MPDPRSILPARPLHARPPLSGPWNPWSLFGLALIAGFIVYSAVWVAPVVATDWVVRGAAVPIRGGHLEQGSCTSKLFMQMCDLTLTAPGPSGRITRSLHYVFGSFTMGSFTVQVVGDPAHPDWLTTDLGLDYFWDRVVSLVIDFVLMAALLYGAVFALMKAANVRTFWRTIAMDPVPLTLVKTQKVKGGMLWTVRADDGEPVNWTMPRRAKPFVLSPEGRVLGLAHQRNGRNILPLDSKLKWVALSGAERAAALAAAGRA